MADVRRFFRVSFRLLPLVATLGLTVGLTAPAEALRGQTVLTGLQDPLFATAPAGDRRLFVVEKAGRVRVVSPSGIKTFLDIRDLVDDGGERGLLGLAFDPDFRRNGRLYVNYIDANTLDTVVARFTVRPGSDGPVNRRTRQTILRFPQEPFANHKAGWIGFRPGEPRHLYIATGDGGSGYDPNDNGQNRGVLLGKMLRVDVSGRRGGYRIPDDNPFVGVAGTRPEIWALGLRNPFRVSFDRRTGAFWLPDVGQDSREEINFERPDDPGGHNYGWRLREGTIATPGVGGDAPGLTDPVFDYPHLGRPGSLGQAIIGGYVYRGPPIAGADGRYFFGDFVANSAYSFAFDADGTPTAGRDETRALLAGTGLQGLSSFGEDGRGRLYLIGQNGTVVVMCDDAPDADAAVRCPDAAVAVPAR